MMTKLNKNLIAAALTLAAAGALHAQNASRTTSYGNGSWGGSVNVAGHANVGVAGGTLTADLGASMTARVRLAGRNIEAIHVAGDFDAAARPVIILGRRGYRTTVSTGATVRLGGNTVFRQTRTNTFDFAADLRNGRIFGSAGARMNVQLGPFGLTLTANASADVDFDIDPTLAGLQARLDITANGQVNGRASASVSAFGVTAGVAATIDLADPVAVLSLQTNFFSAGGSLRWATNRIRVAVDVFARGWGLSLSQRIVNLSLPGLGRTVQFSL